MHKHCFKYFFLLFLLLGCSVKPVPTPQNEVDKLTRLFKSLDSKIPYKERKHLSADIFKKTRRLTEEYKLTSPPLWHNFLVNMGFRNKGLCYHWSDALYLHLEAKNYKSFSFYLIGANIGKYFFEHNALLVVKKDANAIRGGIVIDPWRESGKLYFIKLEHDPMYRWKRRKAREPFTLK
ncbi:MAG: hypothetical protein L3J43_07205 [Sulfurovum sp.]|nr:hypothetical protein [Sulfurovum sp.]